MRTTTEMAMKPHTNPETKREAARAPPESVERTGVARGGHDGRREHCRDQLSELHQQAGERRDGDLRDVQMQEGTDRPSRKR